MMSGFCECMSEKLDKEAEIVVQLLDKMNFTVSTAESCTGGLISAEITSAAGASKVFELGICTYSERCCEQGGRFFNGKRTERTLGR